jgi:hypothetical protein
MGENGSESATIEELLVFDSWVHSCVHQGYLARERIGNISLIAALREWVEAVQSATGKRFPVISGKIIYDGVHAGDYLDADDVRRLTLELDELGSLAREPFQREFLGAMRRLCEASVATGNLIGF